MLLTIRDFGCLAFVALAACATLAAVSLPEITASGQLVRFALNHENVVTAGLAYDPVTNRIWFTRLSASKNLGYIAEGQPATLTTVSSGAYFIANIPGHGMWFTNNSTTVGRIGSNGKITTYQIAHGHHTAIDGICEGFDGRIWVTVAHGRRQGGIGRGAVFAFSPV